MKYLARIIGKTRVTLLSAVLSSLLLSACGGGAGTAVSLVLSGVGGTGIGVGGTGIVFGAITGFGSVFVNNDRFITEESKFIVDGEELDQSALAVGMVIRVDAATENGEYTGDAIRVIYDDEVEGPIDDIMGITMNPDGTKSFYVFGQKVTIDDIGTRFVGTTFGGIAVDDIVEISGFRISETEISATYVEKTGVETFGVSEVELRGTIKNYSPAPNESFEINGITITVDRSDPDLEIEVPGGLLEDDLYVEVEGILQAASEIEAKEIELEDENFGEDVEDVRIQGIISSYVDDSDFTIDGQRIDATGAEIEPQGAVLGVGIEVEVEGDIVGGVLFADEVEVEEGETGLRSVVDSVDTANNRLEMGFVVSSGPSTVVVNVDAQTVFEDETGPVITPPFSLDDLEGRNDYLRVEGQEVNGEVLASVIKRVEPDDDDGRSIEAAVDDYLQDSFITVLGITFQLVPGITEYESNPAEIEVGDFVEVLDEEDPTEVPPIFADGIADEVEEE